MAFKMKYKKGGFPFKVDLTKKHGLGPRDEFDLEKFEKYTKTMQGMENVEKELFSDKSIHDLVKRNLKKKNK